MEIVRYLELGEAAGEKKSEKPRNLGGTRIQLKGILVTSVLVDIVVMYVFLFRPFINQDGSISRFMY
jgi:hypothetical protein